VTKVAVFELFHLPPGVLQQFVLEEVNRHGRHIDPGEVLKDAYDEKDVELGIEFLDHGESVGYQFFGLFGQVHRKEDAVNVFHKTSFLYGGCVMRPTFRPRRIALYFKSSSREQYQLADDGCQANALSNGRAKRHHFSSTI
jgi:hypothetical protein